MPEPAKAISLCYHCGNRVPLVQVGSYLGRQLFEHMEGERFDEAFEYFVYSCPTCEGVSIFGDLVKYPSGRSLDERRLYPQGNRLLPERHKLVLSDCVPARIISLYNEVWPLRHIAPDAFAGQVRRALEFICLDQKAKGRTLAEQLKDLAARGTFPGHFAEMTDLMRHVGNLGVHAGETSVDFWDAELLDDSFRSVVEYVYIAPSRIERMRQRAGVRASS